MNPSSGGDKAELNLSSGYLCSGTAFGSCTSTTGEVVFNTGMAGYTEAITDPSYTGQILVLTYPLAGNYGVPSFPDSAGFESSKICVSGLVVSSLCKSPSHFNSEYSLSGWLHSCGVPGISGVDTRALAKHLREFGTMQGGISCKGSLSESSELSPAKRMMTEMDREVRIHSSNPSGQKKIVLVDCGSKNNIIRHLFSRGISVVRVPWDYPFASEDCDGILLSNGPGDPCEWSEVIAETGKLIDSGKPVLGICLGHQILALAAGASTGKMIYGHRGQNQPCLEQGAVSPRFFLTSQNHGYQVLEDSLPPGWRVLFRNVNDNTVEGITHKYLPLTGVQFHPEASPGPIESSAVFDEFVSLVQNG